MTVSAPAFVAIAIELRSTAASVMSVTIKTPSAVHLTVPPRGRALTVVPGLRAGNYAILINGRRAGALIAGAQPGP